MAYSSAREQPGQGFLCRIPGGLPSNAEALFERLSSTDKLMNEFRDRRLTDSEYSMLIMARNAVQHRLISLQSWEHLPERERDAHSRVMYECCRITALLYSNAVLFPIPLNTGWHRRLCQQLRNVMQASLFDSLLHAKESRAVLLWSLYIGAMAAFHTPERSFFLDSLRQILAQQSHEYTSWQVVESVLLDFLWTDTVCGQGAAVVWHELQRESKL